MSYRVTGVNDYSFLFKNNSSSSGNLASLTNSMFGGDSGSMYGDYAMIKSGAYKKLLTAYYKTQKEAAADSTDQKETQKTDSSKTSEKTSQYVAVKNDADALKNAAETLKSSALYRETTDEEGKTSYNRQGIKEAVEKYVSSYNALLDSSSKVDSTSILSKSLSIVKQTAANKNLLKEAGITIGKDNKLTVDTEKLAQTDISTLTSLFKGNGSYTDSIAVKASELSRQANSASYASGNNSSYSQSGSYSALGNTNSILDQLL